MGDEIKDNLVTRLAELLDLGPFRDGASRDEKWRTTEQLAHGYLERWGEYVSLDQIQAALEQHEAEARFLLEQSQAPSASIRRATYPDRRTAMPLWGSTKHLGQPWLQQASARREADADDIPESLRVPDSAPRIFLSHAARDGERTALVAKEFVAMGFGPWLFETHIGYRGNIADCVRTAIAAAAHCAAFVTRDSVASLWVLTELHTALQTGKPVSLIVDASDEVLVRLLASLHFPHPESALDCSVEFDRAALDLLSEDYRARELSETRRARYAGQVKDFLATLPLYLSLHQHRTAALAYPRVPSNWSGPIQMAPLSDLKARVAGPTQLQGR